MASETAVDQINGNMSTNINAAVLVIIGEPFSGPHKDLISEKLHKGMYRMF